MDEELLNLGLAVANDSSGKSKRKRWDDSSSLQLCQDYEGKVIRLLHMREQMLRTEPKKEESVEDDKGLHLIHLLLISAATEVDKNKFDSAMEDVIELYRIVSLTGNSVQRVAAYFADGLAAKLLTRKSPFFNMIMKEPTTEEQFLAFTEFYRISPYYQFAHFTANQAIIEAFEEEEEQNNRSLHVIDFNISNGFQWPSLIQSLSEKATSDNQISLHITGYSTSLEELIQTETRLVNFAKGFHNLIFEFQGLLRDSIPICSPRKDENETVAVNMVFYLHTFTTSLQISDTLKSVYSLNPSIVILVEQESSQSPRSFLSRFIDSLNYFAAMFDSLDDCLPRESSMRLSIEKNHLGKEIKKMIYCEKDDENYQRHERLETWKGRMESHGFKGFNLSSKSLIQAKLLLKIRSHCSHLGGGGGFRVFERDEGKALSLGWQDRYLITASAWHCL
ncbi:PREDICTED: scarecrow-like protein 21 [Nelumbo nucifera]|uniref:Scarecrow-like protein 21 n=2 Tax=Nelumbo nucifera TaxID=4432 RepID=A0A1U8B0C0_NELNU|nr:PREDICTED: scarecrow-like protein 21 [Nelumbo nucifera]DAD24364.1 TPA_asm: hypothetical protein HUJ06_025828 [Nelumbo nucifera]